MFEVWVCFWLALGVRAASCNVSLYTKNRRVLSVLQAGGRAGSYKWHTGHLDAAHPIGSPGTTCVFARESVQC